MPTVLITPRLILKPRLVAGIHRMAVEVTEPVGITPPRSMVSVSGMVLLVTRNNNENCYLEVQQSPDLWTWDTVNGPKGALLPNSPAPFDVSGIEIDMPYARLRYIMRGVILEETHWVLQATLNTGWK